MKISADNFAASLAAARVAVAAIPDGLGTVKGLDDHGLLEIQRGVSDLRRVIDARSSLLAGEVAFRSRRDLGYAGLAQREGFRSAEKLVQSATGSTTREASTLVTAGTMVHEAMIDEAVDPATGEVREGFAVREPWLTAVGTALSTGSLTVEAARSIRSGLGEPAVDEEGAGVTVESLASAVARLLDEATELDADRLFKLARQLRDELDQGGIAVREQVIYEQRAFRRTRRPNGLSRFTLDPDLETAALLDDLFDNLLSPRRGGPRFVDPEGQAWAQSVMDDPRSNDQYLHDAVTGLLRLGVSADRAGTPRIVGSRTPSVRVLVTEDALTTGTGAGRLEGMDIPISIDSVKRIACEGGILPIRFTEKDDVVALGRQERLFTGRQKVALAARDGGCLWPGCDRSPNWTEAHHITPWASGGNTDLRDGVLLCRHHHMLLHDNHWEIEITSRGGPPGRSGGPGGGECEYWLVPPPEVDLTRTRRPMPSKSPALHDALRTREPVPA